MPTKNKEDFMAEIPSLDTVCLSKALSQALDDLEAVERSDDLVVDMNQWVEFRMDTALGSAEDGELPVLRVLDRTGKASLQFNRVRCAVCLAGAVMFFRANCFSEGMAPWYFPDDANSTLSALDLARRYRFHDMLEEFYQYNSKYDRTVDTLSAAIGNLKLDPVSYEESPEIFKEDMRSVVRCLKEYGC